MLTRKHVLLATGFIAVVGVLCYGWYSSQQDLSKTKTELIGAKAELARAQALVKTQTDLKRGKDVMTLKRMDNVLIVVDDLEAAKAFFLELGLKLEGESTVEGPLVGKLIGLKDVRATLAMMRTPDGQGIELDKFHTPNAIRFGPVNAPVNTLGIRRVMFAVDDIDAVVARMRAHGAELIGEMQYEDKYRLAYIRGPEGIIVALAEQLG